MPTNAERNEMAYLRPEPPRPVFRNACSFLEEWHRTNQSLSPNRRKVLDVVVMQGKPLSPTARALGVSRERARQLLKTYLDAIREDGAANPNGELAYTRDSLTDITATLGITTWIFHKMSEASRQTVIQQINNIGAISPEQAHLINAACRLTNKPANRPLDLKHAERSLRQILNTHPDGVTPADAKRLMQNERAILDSWPRLNIAKFAVAKLLAVVTPQGMLKRSNRSDKPDKPRIIADLMVHALQDARDCLHIQEIVEAARNLAQAQGLEIPYTTKTCRGIANSDDRFRWVANSTYGLTEWNIGHSRPQDKAGRRIGISDEILFLLEQDPAIDFRDLMEHINRRFRIPEATVRAAIYTSPHLITRNALITRTEHADQSSLPPCQDVQIINPSTLMSLRMNAGMSRSELAALSGTNYDAIRRYETGEQNPRPGRLKDIASALGIDPDDLLRNSTDAEAPSA